MNNSPTLILNQFGKINTLNFMKNISVLCVHSDSNYYKIQDLSQDLDIYDKKRDAYNFNSKNTVIAHPPCQQWSKLKASAKQDKREKDLALLCYEWVNKNGGILEHPLGSSLFDYVNADKKNIYLVHQHIFGFPAQKPTLLYTKDVHLIPIPSHKPGSILNLKNVNQLTPHKRSKMTIAFCYYLISSAQNFNYIL